MHITNMSYEEGAIGLDRVELLHGDGGKYTSQLIKEVFYDSYGNSILLEDSDSAVIKLQGESMAFTTDSFTVKPIFFRGGDIGKLAICGTINDLTVSGAIPLYLSVGFIIEEGFPISQLKNIALSMRNVCKETNVKIVTGDTKVVEKGSAEGIFINTSGVGIINGFKAKEIKDGDHIIITGTIAEHGTAVAVDRYNLNVKGDIKSDCFPLCTLLPCLDKYKDKIKLMKDPTRGGIGEVLNEIAIKSGFGVHLFESKIPITKEVKWVNEMLGLDPLYLASEGRMLIVVENIVSKYIISDLKKTCNCNNASVIGVFTKECEFVYTENLLGGKRILNPLDYHMLPRIC